MKSLAVKYRPKTFADVVEQKEIRTILEEQLRTNTQKNCYLFTGGAGTGKTTCARIFASEINKGCGTPIEVDAASNNGVENVREIIDNAKFKALDADYKVYIIDECHMLSTGAWNAMLKLIEEPPAFTIFIFCTTDPQKIPATILSRVQRYDFKRISQDSVVTQLKFILDAEKAQAAGYTYEDAALQYIAKLADGGMRDAIMLMDKCVSYSPDVTLQNVVKALGTVDYTTMFLLLDALAADDEAAVVRVIETVHRDGKDLKRFITQFTEFVLDLEIYDLVWSFDYISIPQTYKDAVEAHVPNFGGLALVDTLIKLQGSIKFDTSPKPLIIATLLLFCDAQKEVADG
jgi:DNA polymerase III subunit gamma/tau